MNADVVANWFKTTLPGIILLGALGSVVAYFVLKACRWAAKRYAVQFLNKWFSPIRRDFLFAKIIAMKLSNASPHKAMQLLVFQATGFCVSSVVFFSLLVHRLISSAVDFGNLGYSSAGISL